LARPATHSPRRRARAHQRRPLTARPPPTHVRALEERIALEITFPRIDGYRYVLPAERLTARFTRDSNLALTTADIPTSTENRGIVGGFTIDTLDDFKKIRPQQVAFHIARRIAERYFRDEMQNPKPWLFPDLLRLSQEWMETRVTLRDNTFIQLLMLSEFNHHAADRIYAAIASAQPGEKRLMPIPKSADPTGSTRYVSFDTRKPTWRTAPDKCHISHVVCDTDTWEQKLAESLEDMAEVVAYVKNHNLQFHIPYSINGERRNYIPDFIVRLRLPSPSGRGVGGEGSADSDILNLIIEVTGARDKDKEAKVMTARNLWVPAVNNAGTWGRWAFIEVVDPWDAKQIIRSFVEKDTSREPINIA